jgi:O-antigen/teichoic acid export membrane protein
MMLSLLGAILVTRIVGAGNYGLYNAAYGIFNFFLSVGLMGTSVYLIRSARDAPISLFHLAFWWLLGFGIAIAVVVGSTIAVVGHYWFRTEGFVPIALALCANIPLTLVSYVPLALLERRLDYRKTTTIEVTSQVVNYIFTIPLAWQGYGAWALVAGFWASQLVLPLGFFWMARYRPRWYWDTGELRGMLRYSFSPSRFRMGLQPEELSSVDGSVASGRSGGCGIPCVSATVPELCKLSQRTCRSPLNSFVCTTTA